MGFVILDHPLNQSIESILKSLFKYLHHFIFLRIEAEGYFLKFDLSQDMDLATSLKEAVLNLSIITLSAKILALLLKKCFISVMSAVDIA